MLSPDQFCWTGDPYGSIRWKCCDATLDLSRKKLSCSVIPYEGTSLSGQKAPAKKRFAPRQRRPVLRRILKASLLNMKRLWANAGLRYRVARNSAQQLLEPSFAIRAF